VLGMLMFNVLDVNTLILNRLTMV